MRVLLDLRGGRAIEEGIWLLSSEASLCEERGQMELARELYERAYDQALADRSDRAPDVVAMLAQSSKACSKKDPS